MSPGCRTFQSFISSGNHLAHPAYQAALYNLDPLAMEDLILTVCERSVKESNLDARALYPDLKRCIDYIAENTSACEAIGRANDYDELVFLIHHEFVEKSPEILAKLDSARAAYYRAVKP